MGFLNEQIDVNIKMSKRVKYFFIGLFIGILSSFIGIYISSEFFVEPIHTENIQNSYNAGLKKGFVVPYCTSYPVFFYLYKHRNLHFPMRNRY